MAEKTYKWALVMTPEEHDALAKLAAIERISEAAVVRRLIWAEALICGIVENEHQSKLL